MKHLEIYRNWLHLSVSMSGEQLVSVSRLITWTLFRGVGNMHIRYKEEILNFGVKLDIVIE